MVTLALLFIGVVMVYSASAVLSERLYDDATRFLKKQTLWVGLGVLAMLLAAQFPYRYWQRLIFPMIVVTSIALIAVLTPLFGLEINGSRRWLRLGYFSIQPSEVARLTLVMYLAAYLVKRREHLGDFATGFLPPICTVGFLMTLVLVEPDFGTAAVMGTVTGILMFVGGARLRHLLGTTLLSLPVLYAMVMKTGYRKERILAFLDPWKDPTDKGFQIIQSFIALGQGGAMGMGLGEGRQKLFFLPYPHTDFIFAVIGEELGLMGTILVVGLFVLLAWCGMRIALCAPDLFGQYLAFGITLMIVLQAQVNMAVVTGLLPTKGLALPLLSYGGSSLVVNLVGIGILLNISKFQGPGGRQVKGTKRVTKAQRSLSHTVRVLRGGPR